MNSKTEYTNEPSENQKSKYHLLNRLVRVILQILITLIIGTIGFWLYMIFEILSVVCGTIKLYVLENYFYKVSKFGSNLLERVLF